MFCQNCGNKLDDDAIFCDACGAKVVKKETIVQPASQSAEKPVEKKETLKEGKIYKCPFCGEVLPYDAIKCPSCGNEIRGREVTSSIKLFFDKYSALDEKDVDKKIDLIKSFPIPNSREDIIEFMVFASSNFDAKYYATNQKKDSVASAWLAKIDLCYEKGKSMFTDARDLKQIEDIYSKAHSDVRKMSKTRLILISGGIATVAIGVILVCLFQKVQAVQFVGIALLAIGIIAIVFGAKRKKTNKELAEEKAEKARKEELKILKKKNKK